MNEFPKGLFISFLSFLITLLEKKPNQSNAVHAVRGQHVQSGGGCMNVQEEDMGWCCYFAVASEIPETNTLHMTW